MAGQAEEATPLVWERAPWLTRGPVGLKLKRLRSSKH
jgi:hypothetical protein